MKRKLAFKTSLLMVVLTLNFALVFAQNEAAAERPMTVRELLPEAEKLEIRGQFEDAIKIYSRLLLTGEQTGYILERRSFLYMKTNKLDEAIADLTLLIARAPREFRFWANRGIAYRRRKQFDKALADLNQAYSLNSADLKILRTRAGTLLDLNQLERAEQDVNEILSRAPGAAASHVLRSVLCSRRYDTSCILSESKKALEIDADDAAANNNFGYGLILIEKPAEAIKYLEKAHEREAAWAYPVNNLGRAYIMLKQWETATQNINQALVFDNTLAEVYDNKGLLLLEAGRLDDALGQFDKAISLGSGIPAALRHRGKANLLKNNGEAALKDLNRSIELDPNSAESYDIRAAVFRAIGDNVRGQADAEMAQKIRATYIY